MAAVSTDRGEHGAAGGGTAGGWHCSGVALLRDGTARVWVWHCWGVALPRCDTWMSLLPHRCAPSCAALLAPFPVWGCIQGIIHLRYPMCCRNPERVLCAVAHGHGFVRTLAQSFLCHSNPKEAEDSVVMEDLSPLTKHALREEKLIANTQNKEKQTL